MNDSSISSPKKLVYNTDDDIPLDIKSSKSIISNNSNNTNKPNTKNLERLNTSKIEKIINYESSLIYTILDEDLALINQNRNINIEEIIEKEANFNNTDKEFDEIVLTIKRKIILIILLLISKKLMRKLNK